MVLNNTKVFSCLEYTVNKEKTGARINLLKGIK